MKVADTTATTAAQAKLRVQAVEGFFAPLSKVGAVVRVGSTVWQSAEMLPDERAFVAQAVQSRQTEFALGRALARNALKDIGHLHPTTPVAIPVGGDRAPNWPTGIIGSISHCQDICVAVVARRAASVRAIGVDIERIAAIAFYRGCKFDNFGIVLVDRLVEIQIFGTGFQ